MTDFETARLAGMLHLQDRVGIGTLSERSLHAVLKYWMEPDETFHEVRVDGLVADIFDGRRVVEIQTRSLYPLRKKLERLLPAYPVTVVVPVVRNKRLIWMDPETGETTAPRKSPRVGGFADGLGELFRLEDYLGHPRLTMLFVELDVEEYRIRDGWGNGGKRGSHRAERIPTAMGRTLRVNAPLDYASLLPEGLPDPFTTADLRKCGRLSAKKAGDGAKTLYKLGALVRTGKRGNAYLYRIPQGDRPESEETR